MVFVKGLPDSLDSTSLERMLSCYKSERPLRRKTFYGSDVCYCPRRAVLFRIIDKDVTDKIDALSIFYMSIGKGIHRAVCQILKKADVLIEEEIKVEDSHLGVKGIADAIVWLKECPVVIEIKSCGALPLPPSLEHQYQVAFYSILLGIEPHLVYVSRDVRTPSWQLKARTFPVSDELVQRAKKGLAVAHIFFENEIVPPAPPYLLSAKDCKYCPFVKSCWGKAKLALDSSFSFSDFEMKADFEREVSLSKFIRSEIQETLKYIESLKPFFVPP